MRGPRLEKIGEVLIDSGCVIIGDPYGLIFDQDQHSQLGLDWSDFCEISQDEVVAYDYNSGVSGLGINVAVSDGKYEVHNVYNQSGDLEGIYIKVGNKDPKDIF